MPNLPCCYDKNGALLNCPLSFFYFELPQLFLVVQDTVNSAPCRIGCQGLKYCSRSLCHLKNVTPQTEAELITQTSKAQSLVHHELVLFENLSGSRKIRAHLESWSVAWLGNHIAHARYSSVGFCSMYFAAVMRFQRSFFLNLSWFIVVRTAILNVEEFICLASFSRFEISWQIYLIESIRFVLLYRFKILKAVTWLAQNTNHLRSVPQKWP